VSEGLISATGARKGIPIATHVSRFAGIDDLVRWPAQAATVTRSNRDGFGGLRSVRCGAPEPRSPGAPERDAVADQTDKPRW
jgi:hypothetical protein